MFKGENIRISFIVKVIGIYVSFNTSNFLNFTNNIMRQFASGGVLMIITKMRVCVCDKEQLYLIIIANSVVIFHLMKKKILLIIKKSYNYIRQLYLVVCSYYLYSRHNFGNNNNKYRGRIHEAMPKKCFLHDVSCI